MNCVYCVNDDGQGKNGLIPLKIVSELINKYSPEEIEFTGGEPTINFDHLLKAVSIAKKKSSFIVCNSNLELLNGEKIRKLEKSGLTHLHFAFNTFDHKKYMIIRGNPEAELNKVLTNIEILLKETKIFLISEFIPMKINIRELPIVYEYFSKIRKKYGERMKEMEVGRLIIGGRASKDLLPSKKDEIKVFKLIEKTQLPLVFFCYGPKINRVIKKLGFQIYPCAAGKEMFYFDTEGKVFADNFSGYLLLDNFQKFDQTDNPKSKSFVCPYLTKN